MLDQSDPATRSGQLPWRLAPCDLQALKASGVTFMASLLERVIEEQARGDASKANAIREALTETLALGALVNRVTHCDTAPPWTFGIAALMRNLAGRGLLRVGYRQRIYEEEWPFAHAARTQAAIK